MAVVYEGKHAALGKRVAVKLVQSLFANDDEIVQRFEREARSASAVESERIVHVFDVGADPELGLFLVMELLKGEDLSTVLARRGYLDPVFAAGLVKQASMGLEKAHAAGIVHRDLKPANVFLVERDDGTTLVKLVDFGIAKIVRDAEDARFARKGITRRGTAIGTPQYMSPEQAQALDTVDQRTDIFSLRALRVLRSDSRAALHARAAHLRTDDPPARLDEAPASQHGRSDHPTGARRSDCRHARARMSGKRVKDMRTVRARIEGIYPDGRLGGQAPIATAAVGGLPGSLCRARERRSPESRRQRDERRDHGARTRRPLLYIAAFAVAVGATIGIGATWSSRHGAPLPAAPPSAATARNANPPAATTTAPTPSMVRVAPAPTEPTTASIDPAASGAGTANPANPANPATPRRAPSAAPAIEKTRWARRESRRSFESFG